MLTSLRASVRHLSSHSTPTSCACWKFARAAPNHTHIHTHTRARTYTHSHTRAHTQTHTHHTHPSTHIHICTHIHAQTLSDKGNEEEDRHADEFVRECEALKLAQHPNVVRMLGVCKGEDNVYLLMEFCSLGSLLDYLHTHRNSADARPVSSQERLWYTEQVCVGVCTLVCVCVVCV